MYFDQLNAALVAMEFLKF